MAQHPHAVPEVFTAEGSICEAPRRPRLVCGWNDKANTYLYRDQVTNPPPLLGNGPDRVSKRPKKASPKARPSRSEYVTSLPVESNASAAGNEKREIRRRNRAARRRKGRLASPLQPPASEAGRQSHRKRAQYVGDGVESSDSGDDDRDGLDEVPLDRRLYIVPDHSQGTVRPVPKPVNSQGIPWQDIQITMVPLPNDPAVKIGRFDNIMVTLVSPDNGKRHNEPAKVLDCRLHLDGTYFLLVSWWFGRRTLSKSLVGFKRYLDRRWPVDATFKFVLGCHYDVITSDAVTEKVPDGETFCNSLVYGGVTHNCELFSDVPDEVERRELVKKGTKEDARLVEERKQESIFRALLRPELSDNCGQ
ncbi:hypothetical protein ACLOAV_004512 [Pseudogymnoascus australis]